MIYLKKEEETRALDLINAGKQNGHMEMEQSRFGNPQQPGNLPQLEILQQLGDKQQVPGNQHASGNQQLKDGKPAVGDALLGSETNPGQGTEQPIRPDSKAGSGNSKGGTNELEAFFMDDN